MFVTIIVLDISIHAPRAGSDFHCHSQIAAYDTFQSTLPVWGATVILRKLAVYIRISIHAPHVGSDRSSLTVIWNSRNFNPRSPCGERRFAIHQYTFSTQFQSTLPVRGATRTATTGEPCRRISIHAPRAGSDRTLFQYPSDTFYFNPRSPCGERPSGLSSFYHIDSNFNPRSPCGERLPALP